MPYKHEETGSTLDTRLEDFFTFLPFIINAEERILTICPGANKSYMALMSVRRSDEPKRTPPINDQKQRSHVISLNDKNKITINNARLAWSIRHKRSGDLAMLDLFEMQEPVEWFDFSSWSPDFQVPQHIAGNPLWSQTIEIEGAGSLPYAWDIRNLHSAAGKSTALGVVVPLLKGGFTQTILGKCADVKMGSTGKAMPKVTVKSEESQQSFFSEGAGGGGEMPGFVAILAGAFAPIDCRIINYEFLSRLGEKEVPNIADWLDRWVFENWEKRRDIRQKDPNAQLPGVGIPAEIFYVQQLSNISAPILLP